MSPSAARAREQKDSRCIDQDVLSRIQHLNVTGNVVDKSQSAVSYGGFCEVFKGRLRQDGREHLDVAIKRLRFHVDEVKVKKAGPFILPYLVLVGSQQLSSNSPRRSTCGQSYVTHMFCHCWGLLFARTRASPCSFLNGCILVLPGRTCETIKNRTSHTWPFWFVLRITLLPCSLTSKDRFGMLPQV